MEKLKTTKKTVLNYYDEEIVVDTVTVNGHEGTVMFFGEEDIIISFEIPERFITIKDFFGEFIQTVGLFSSEFWAKRFAKELSNESFSGSYLIPISVRDGGDNLLGITKFREPINFGIQGFSEDIRFFSLDEVGVYAKYTNACDGGGWRIMAAIRNKYNLLLGFASDYLLDERPHINVIVKRSLIEM